MSDQYIPVGTHFKIDSGFAFPSEAFVENGIPIVRMSDLKRGRLRFENTKYVNESWIKTSSQFLLEKDDFLIGMSGSLSNFAVVSEEDIPSFLNQRVGRLKTNSKTEDYSYICYWLTSDIYTRYAEIQGEGAAQKNISTKQIENFKYRYATPRQQQKIARILQTIDRAIEQTEALIDKYQQIKAGLMHDLFTRGIGSDGQLRPPREQAPHLYQHTPIGWIPQEWNIERLDVVAEVIDPQPDHRTPPAMVDGVPYIGIGDFDQFGIVDFQKCRKVIAEAFNKQQERFTAKQGDIIFGKIGTIGEPKVLGDGEYALSANVVLIQPKTQSSYLRQILDSWFFAKQVSDVTNTTSQPALGIEKIRAIRIPQPTKDREIDYIAKLLHVFDQKLRSDLCSLNKLQKQKSGLMHDLLTGKVPVQPDPEPAHG